MARNQNKIVLRLPPYHCELNPIELVWAKMKNYVASKNTSFKFQDMKKLFAESIERIDAVKWQNCINHVVEKVEPKMWQLDHIIDEQLDPIIVNLENDSSSSSESDNDDDNP
ncbi:hypothetical protein HHI36_018391 [Cryptolaemus montrouzieri]|uniref:Tc1-like transposase DDE domain-containing protein n=1 Tax=Cryptolaemus montrouzieri TaxID=559131 RepID=A0ABD2P064_9CUCU